MADQFGTDNPQDVAFVREQYGAQDTANSLQFPIVPTNAVVSINGLSGPTVTLAGGTTGFSYATAGTTLTLTFSTTAGSVLFGNAGGNGIAQDNANLFWDDTNNRLGIGTNAPNVPLHVAANLADWGERVINSNNNGEGLVVTAGDSASATKRIVQFRDNADGSVWTVFAAGYVKLEKAYTVATLPTGAVGMIARVSDGDAALAWGATVVNTGAGTTPYLVWFNGTAWKVFAS